MDERTVPQQPARSAPLKIRHGANLPHWTREGATYSITFRLADSLPQAVLNHWVLQREHIVARARQMERELTEFEHMKLEQLHSEKVEAHLDAGHGACWMSNPRIAKIVHDALFHFEGVRHQISAWCVMPNHAHVVVRPLEGFSLPGVLQSWKGFSAREANKVLGRSGTFWQPEPYDHLIRDRADFAHCVEYVLGNPAQVGLTGWQWVGTKRKP